MVDPISVSLLHRDYPEELYFEEVVVQVNAQFSALSKMNEECAGSLYQVPAYGFFV